MNIQLGHNYTRGETISRNLFDCIVDEINWIYEDSDKEEVINRLKQIVDRST